MSSLVTFPIDLEDRVTFERPVKRRKPPPKKIVTVQCIYVIALFVLVILSIMQTNVNN